MEEIIVANLTLDTYQRNKVAPLVVPQGDYGARVIRSKITDLGKPVIVESTAAVSIVATRSGDGESQAFSGSVNADGTVTVPVTQWMLDVPEEDVTCHIVVTGIGYQYSTTNFLIEPQAKATPTEIAPDDPRQDLVTEVLAGENTRRAAEAERVSNENARIAAENARQSAEEQRLTDESTRITNEAQRVSAESSRDATFRSWAQDIASLPTFDGRINAIRKRVENIESGIPAESFIIDDSVAYTKDVPENVAPNAVVQKVGGMTRKCANLWDEIGVNGYYDSTNGAFMSGGGFFACENKIRVSPSTTYYITTPIVTALCFFDAQQGFISYDTYGSSRAFTTPSNCYYMAFHVWHEYGITYKNDIMINEGDPKPYEPYFEGLRSAKVTEVKSVGVNLFDPQKIIDAGGTENNGEYTVGTSDFYRVWNEKDLSSVPCKKGTRYIIGFEGRNDNPADRNVTLIFTIVYTDGSQSTMVMVMGNEWNYQYAVSTAGKDVLRIGVTYSYSGVSYLRNVFIAEYTGDNSYTPYVEHTLPIPETVQALDGYGLGVNENCYNYIAWNPDSNIKTWNKRVGIVDMGTLNWYMGSVFYANIPTRKPSQSNLICSRYKNAETIHQEAPDGTITGNTADGYIYVKDSTYTDAAAFKAAMSGVMLVYELAEPIVTDISDLITADNLIGVEGGGTLTFENEYGYAVPSTIIYQSR